jgi:hypothetical protein
MTTKVSDVLRLGAVALLALPSGVNAQSLPPWGGPYPYPNAELETVVLDITADTSVLQLATTRNYGTSRTLDANRTLIEVSKEAFRTAVGGHDYIASAKLRLTLKPSLLPKLPRTLTVHKVLKNWTELGATWNCAIDSNTSNLRNDCSGVTDWSMTTAGDAFVAAPFASTTLPLFRHGVIEIDVSADIKSFQNGSIDAINEGWLLKADGIDLSALDDFYSRESSAPPQLVMQVRHCNTAICDDGVLCTKDFCEDGGWCVHNSAPPTACDDGDPCTIQDMCDTSECIGVRAPPGTSCGPDGLICTGLGNCIYPPDNVSSNPE